MHEKKLQKVEKELKETKDICQSQNEQIKNLFESKKGDTVIIESDMKRLNEQTLALFENKCDKMSVLCDTLDLILKKD